jgi:hypothetical protein
VTTNFTLAVNPDWANCRLQFGFGFATAETNALSAFLDAYSITLQTQDAQSTLLLQTADVNGVAWAPDNPGGLQVSPDLLLREALPTGGITSGYDKAWAFAVSLVLPSAFVGTTSTLYLDLFDNLNTLGSVGWLTYARLVPGLTTNTAPIVLVQDQTVDERVPLTLTINAFDTDVPLNQITYELLAGPAGLRINRDSGVVKWTPSEAQGPSTQTVTVRVTDNGLPALSTTQSFQIVVQEVNVPPVMAQLASRRIHDGQELAFAFSATDANLPAQTLSFSFGSGAPAGATLTPGGFFRWIPEVGQTGEYDIVVNAVDSGVPALSATSSFHVSVLDVGSLRVQSSGRDIQFLDVTNAVIDCIAQTARLPATSDFALYRLMNDSPTRITGIRVTGGEVLLYYALEVRNVRLQFAPSMGAVFTDDLSAVVDEASQTIRTSLTASARVYRVTADRLTRIVSMRIEGGQIVIRYQQTGESIP